MTKLSRRKIIESVVAAGVATIAEKAGIAAHTSESAADGAPDAIAASDIASTEKIAGLTSTESQRLQMLDKVTKRRTGLSRLRISDLVNGREPATHFQPCLAGTLLPEGKSDVRISRARAIEYTGDPESLAFASASDLARLLKARKVTSVELTGMYLARLKKYGPRLLCVVSLIDDKTALRDAAAADAEIAAGHYRGPLHGIPFGVKDLLAAAGTRTTLGAEPYENQLWDFDSTVVARLKQAGAILVAKLSMGELAMGDVWFGGTTRNPWKPTAGSSGSSAGSASATAAGLVGFSIGTETLGSITSPSQVCGTTGLRPTFGRVSRHGAMPLAFTMDKIGPICRSVEDCALVFGAIQGPDGQDGTVAENVPFRWQPRMRLSKLRVGIDERAWNKLKEDKNAETLAPLYDEVLAKLRSLGVEPTPIALPEWHEEYDDVADILILSEGAASFAKLRADGGLEKLAQQADWNWPNAFRSASTIPAPDYIQALRVRSFLQKAMAEVMRDFDAYITLPGFGPSLLYTNLTGHPTVITRCGVKANGLPLSVEFTAALYREDIALALAHAYEQATPHHKHWPDVDALPTVPPEMEKRS